MIIVDFSNVAMIAASAFHRDFGETPDLQSLRACVLKKISDVVKRTSQYSNEVILALDSRDKYWRKKSCIHYKSKRKKAREESNFDFDLYFQGLNVLIDELKEESPYRVVQASSAEADDVIAVLSKRLAAHDSVCIIGTDKDFMQLQSHDKKIYQFNPTTNRYMTDGYYSLRLHVLNGDASDGIPNIFSPLDSISSGIRQKAFTQKMKDKLLYCSEEDMLKQLDEEQELRYQQNKILIDLSMIPPVIAKGIVSAYEESKANPQHWMGYLIKHKLVSILT